MAQRVMNPFTDEIPMNLEIVILAAGQGTRMKSDLPKVLHPVAGRPMLAHVIEAARELSPIAVHVVVGHGAEQVKERLGDSAINWAIQSEQLGTGHAVMQALPAVKQDSVVLVLYGDVPLIGVDTLRALAEQAQHGPALLTARLADPTGYGRILRNSADELQAVVEHKDASPEQLRVDEVNSGVLAAPAALLAQQLPRVKNDNSQGEYYLPDVLGLTVTEGGNVGTVIAETELEILGINDRLQLNQVEREYQRRQAEQLMREGVHLADAARLDIRGNLTCGRDVFIDVNVVVEGDVTLADGVTVGPNCLLRNVSIGAGTTIEAMSHLEESVLDANCIVGPFARLRPGSHLSDGAKVGNFVETKKATIGPGSKVNHLSYVGDCEMGAGVNVGAGTITCNYDGAYKHKTTLGDGVFIGSNSTLVAPLEIAPGGFVAAGSAVTKAVGEDELAVGRGRQKNISGWQRPVKNNKD